MMHEKKIHDLIFYNILSDVVVAVFHKENANGKKYELFFSQMSRRDVLYGLENMEYVEKIYILK